MSESGQNELDKPMTPIEQVRCALAMAEAGYKWELCIDYAEALLSAYDSQAAELTRLQQSESALREAQAWRPMETAPHNKEILGTWGGCVQIVIFSPTSKEWYAGENWIQTKDLLGWMPLPAALASQSA